MNERTKELLIELGANKAKKGKAWKDYEVFIPVYSGNPIIGLPLVILQKGDEARISTGEEALEYLKYKNTH